MLRAFVCEPQDQISHVGRLNPFRKIRDRKSTRLNSSHGYISYAVFCLKKNKPSPGEPDHPDHIPVTGRPTRQPLPPGHNDQNGAARSAIASVDAESSSVAQSHVSAAT